MRFEVLAAMAVKFAVFWDITPCSPLNIHRLLCLLPFLGENQATNNRKKAIGPAYFLQVDSLCLLHQPEDGDNKFHRNVSKIRTARHHVLEDSVLNNEDNGYRASLCACCLYKDSKKVCGSGLIE